MTKRLHVAVGVILGVDDTVLIAKRPTHQHQGGKWEFPGGKVEQGETVTQALTRELKEEVAINVESTFPLMKLTFDYPDKKVLLDVHKVTKFKGQAIGNEGQQIEWVKKSQLIKYDFPEANKTILEKLLCE